MEQLREAFNAAIPGLVFRLTIKHDAQPMPAGLRPVANCLLTVELLPANDENAIVSFSVMTRADDDIAESLPCLSLWGGSRGGVLLLPGTGRIDHIHRDELERLHAFLQNMRGVCLKFTPDLFGRRGPDQESRIELPFPQHLPA